MRYREIPKPLDFELSLMMNGRSIGRRDVVRFSFRFNSKDKHDRRTNP